MATIYSGTDVARYQSYTPTNVYSPIDWPTYAANKDFVIIKAAGGDDGLYTDSSFGINQAGARAQAGLRVGYYFFGDANIDAATSANYMIGVLGSLNNGEIVVLDIENHAGGLTPNDGWAYVFCSTIFQAYNIYPFVYMSQFSPTSTSLSWPHTSAVAHLWMANYSLSSTNFSSTAGNADSAWGGSGAPNYRLLQYSSSGSVPGIARAVDLDTFYSPNNTLADWDAFGFNGASPTPTPPTPAVPGDLTTATVSNPVIVYTEPAQQTVNLPKESYDQVLYSDKFHTTVTSSSWPVNIAGPATGLTQYALPIGNYNYSIAGIGSGLNDYGFINAGDYGQFPGTLPSVVVQPIVNSKGSLSFDVVVNNISGSVTVDLFLNIALLAYPNTTSVPISSVTQSVSRSNVFLGGSPNAYATYRRVDTATSVGSGATTYIHDQATIPNLLYWVQDNSGDIEPQPVTWKDTGAGTGFGMSMDATNVYFNVDAAANAKCWFTIYKDN